MKETKTARLEIRLTNSEKEKLREYAAEHNKTISEVVKELCQFIFEGG
jgi:uncharacterized protein (DUF1778 family)